jgi:Vitelline membrane outer layer protein I (VOMI)
MKSRVFSQRSLIATLLLALSACGPQSDNPDASETPTPTKPFDSNSLMSESNVGTLNVDIGSSLGSPTASSRTCGAANQYSPSCAYSSAPDQAYSWSAPYSGTFTFTTFGSDYDTVLHIYDRTTGTALGCNDDSGGTLQSSLAISLSANQPLLIVVDGYAGSCGNSHLNISGSVRSDYVGTIEPPASAWGNWEQAIYCSPGSYAIGYKLQVEPYRGSDDDTGLNSVQLFCQTPSGVNVGWISGFNNGWGTWGDPAYCLGTGNFINGAHLRVEGYQGSRDDTAANDVEMGCYNGGNIHTTNGPEWGSFGDWAYCPANTVVCGLSIRFEPYRGGDDDTAMNALRLHCCRL